MASLFNLIWVITAHPEKPERYPSQGWDPFASGRFLSPTAGRS